MANFDLSYIIKALDNFSPTFEKLKNDLSKQEQAVSSFQKRMNGYGANLKSWGSTLLTHVTLPLIGMATYAAKTYANFDEMKLRLEAMTKTSADAAKSWKIIHDLSGTMPFSQEDLTGAEQQILSTGKTSLEDSKKRLVEYGMVAKVANLPLEEVASSFSRMEKRGSGALRMLSSMKGVPIVATLREMYKEVHKTDKGFEAWAKHPIGINLIKQALDRMTESGSQFANAAEKMFNTPTAQLERLHSQMRNYIDDMVESLVNTKATTNSLKQLNEYLKVNEDAFKEWLKNNPDILKMAVGIGAIAAAIGPLMILGALFLAIISPITLIGIGVGVIIYAIYKLYELFKTSGKEILNTLLNCILHPFELARKEIELIIALGKKFFGLFSGESVKVPLIETYGISAPVPQQPQGINAQTLFGGANFGGNLASINSGGIAKASVGIDMHIVDKGKNVGSVASKTSGLNYFNTDLGDATAFAR